MLICGLVIGVMRSDPSARSDKRWRIVLNVDLCQFVNSIVEGQTGKESDSANASALRAPVPDLPSESKRRKTLQEAGQPGPPGSQGCGCGCHTRPLPAGLGRPRQPRPSLLAGPLAGPGPSTRGACLPNESLRLRVQLRESCTFWTSAAPRVASKRPLARGSLHQAKWHASSLLCVPVPLQRACRPSPATPRPPGQGRS
jgi:hypothetical protein